MSVLSKIIALGAVCAFISSIFKQSRNEYSIFISVAFGILVFALLGSVFSRVIESVREIAKESRINSEYLNIILKVIGISYICEYASAVFTDAGESAIAKKIEFSGKFIIFILSLPIINALFGVISKLF